MIQGNCAEPLLELQSVNGRQTEVSVKASCKVTNEANQAIVSQISNCKNAPTEFQMPK